MVRMSMVGASLGAATSAPSQTPREGQRRGGSIDPGVRLGGFRTIFSGGGSRTPVEVYSAEHGWVAEDEYQPPEVETTDTVARNRMVSAATLARRQYTGLGGGTIRTSQRGLIGRTAQTVRPSLIGSL